MKKAFKILVSVILVIGIGYLLMARYLAPEPEIHQVDPASSRTTMNGNVIGFLEPNKTHAWLGIPYAKPPLANLRWKAPEPPENWESDLEALEICSPCTQVGGPLSNVPKKEYGKVVGSEDCLYLNIWAPRFAPDKIPSGSDRLPVMVWIHGGGNSVGHGGGYNGKYLAEKYNLIIVAINYRLGPFGWFHHPAWSGSYGTPEDRSGNYGTLDIIRALSWIRDNISSFGGNLENVTLFGESAGAVDTFSMMLSPKAKGLFHKAIAQSGMVRAIPFEKAQEYKDAAIPGHDFSSREVINFLLIKDNSAKNRGEAMALQNKMTDEEIVRYLSGKSNQEILSLYTPGAFGMISFPALFQDGNVLPEGDALEIFKDGKAYNAVPLIIGTNRDEFKTFMAQDPRFVKSSLNIFRWVKDWEYYDLFSRYQSDAWKAVGVDQIAVAMSESNGEKIFGYRFDWDEEPSILGMNMGRLIGAGHGMEIPFVFHNFDRGSGLMDVLFTSKNLPGRKSLSDGMSSYWAEFAYTGSPGKGRNGKESFWASWGNPSKEKNQFMVLDTPEGGGFRMSSDTVSLPGLKNQLKNDGSFSNDALKCPIYGSLFKGTPLWDDEEYQHLTKTGCPEYTEEGFFK